MGEGGSDGRGVGEVKALLQLTNFTLGPDANRNTEIYRTNSVRIKAPNSVNASKRKHKNQLIHYNKQRRVLMTTSSVILHISVSAYPVLPKT